jgi:hypothetical protein
MRALLIGPIHCLYLTAKTEGPLAWYKGTTAHLARIAPHTVSLRLHPRRLAHPPAC